MPDSLQPLHATAHSLRRIGVCFLFLGLHAHAMGQGLPADALEQARSYLEQQAPAELGRVEVRVGTPDPRLKLAPCKRFEPMLPTGLRAWGKTTVVLRCMEGASWQVSLAAQVSVIGKALVATESMRSGSTPHPESWTLSEIELTQEPGTPIQDPVQLVGKTLNRGLSSGQILRLEYLRSMPTVAAGDPVRVQISGAGFIIQAEGQLLAAAAEGQAVRVRTEQGRILSGLLRGRTVEVRL